MSRDAAKLKLALSMRDHLRTIRAIAMDVELAAVAIEEEQKINRRVEEMEKRAAAPELDLHPHSHAA